MTTITIELSNEDRKALDGIYAKLDAILEALKEGAPAPHEGPVQAAEAPTEKPAEAPTEKPAEAPKEEKPAEAPAEKPAEEAAPFAEVSVDDVRSKVITLSAAGLKQQAREIVRAYADKVSDIPADKCAEVLAKLKKLEG